MEALQNIFPVDELEVLIQPQWLLKILHKQPCAPVSQDGTELSCSELQPEAIQREAEEYAV